MKLYDFKNDKLPDEFKWFNEPKSFCFDGGLIIKTKKDTDFWQRTHYGFRRDDGHCLLTELKENFTIETEVSFNPKNQYDQCGLIVRIDENNWIKCSAEYENENFSRLGSVVTRDGYSDWATVDIAGTLQQMCYRITKENSDYFIFNSENGKNWKQMRITHMESKDRPVFAGIYTCSPQGEDFECKISYIKVN